MSHLSLFPALDFGWVALEAGDGLLDRNRLELELGVGAILHRLEKHLPVLLQAASWVRSTTSTAESVERSHLAPADHAEVMDRDDRSIEPRVC